MRVSIYARLYAEVEAASEFHRILVHRKSRVLLNTIATMRRADLFPSS
jgi:hypothetical protein